VRRRPIDGSKTAVGSHFWCVIRMHNWVLAGT
jgi:hypothetical protein